MIIRCLKYFLLLFVCFYSGAATAQVQTIYDSTIYNWKEYFDLSYGPDYNLINGIKYLYLYSNVSGHPFFGENQFYTGHLVIADREYQDVYLKYDIYNQNMILQYSPFTGGTDQILLKNEFIHEFKIDGKLFRKYSFSETGTRFFQVVTSGKIYCLYYWEKDLNYSTLSLYNFTPQKKKAYIVMNSKPYRFKSKKQFLKLFPVQHQKEIKQFIRNNKIWLKNASDDTMRRLLEFCNQLTENK
ncbi:MAG: hypothetical protein KAU83_08380 [Bacteroidales bacterium]|nr:hypothetical protein [Bacteroidales bacterium]